MPLDGGDVDLFRGHHRLEGALGGRGTDRWPMLLPPGSVYFGAAETPDIVSAPVRLETPMPLRTLLNRVCINLNNGPCM